jgi:methionyl-tRNA formyltransferase
MAGDDMTGATTFRLVAELDAGDVFGVVTEPIRPSDTAGDLLGRLSDSGAGLLTATMDGIESGELVAVPQPPDGISLAPKITSERARVTWSQPAVAIGRQIRGCTPQPGAWTDLGGTRVKLLPLASVAAVDPGGPLEPGELRVLRSRVLVGTGTTPVQLGEVQAHGKRQMPAADWARGLRQLAASARLT